MPRRALIVVDAQQEYFTGLFPIQYPPRDESIKHIVAAVEAAENAGIPVVIVQHNSGEGAGVFNPNTPEFELHPALGNRDIDGKHLVKSFASIFAETDLDSWLRERQIDMITLTGYMTNNCILASTADAEPRGFAVEVLSDATGAIDLKNKAGSVNAQTVHTTLMLHSNWAAVASTHEWTEAVSAGVSLEKDNLVASAAAGASAAGRTF